MTQAIVGTVLFPGSIKISIVLNAAISRVRVASENNSEATLKSIASELVSGNGGSSKAIFLALCLKKTAVTFREGKELNGWIKNEVKGIARITIQKANIEEL